MVLLPLQLNIDFFYGGGIKMGGEATVEYFDKFNFNQKLLPQVEFEVDLTLNTTEQIGPPANLRIVPVYHSEGNSADATRAIVKQRETQFSGILQRLSQAGGREVKHGDRFTVEGEKAIYLRDMYTTEGASHMPQSGLALLKVVGANSFYHDKFKQGLL